jgi:hypothetical protein
MSSVEEVRPLARRDDLLIEKLDGELVVYDLIHHRASCLNDSAALVWKLCDGVRTVAQISAELSEHTGLPNEPELTLLCLARLRAAKLLARDLTLPSVSRRQVVKRLALKTALMALLPAVLTVRAEAQVSLASCVHRSQCLLPQNQCSPCYQGAQVNSNQCNNRRCHNGDCRPRGQTPCP